MLTGDELNDLAELVLSRAVLIPVTDVQLVMAGWTTARRKVALEVLRGLDGLSAEAVAAALSLAGKARRAEALARPAPELVWAAFGQGHARSTTAVASELIARAEVDLIAVTYSFGVAQGTNPVFVALQARLVERPAMRVRLVLGRIAKAGDTRAWTALRDLALRDFERYWPGAPYAEVYVPSAPEGVEGGGVGARVVHAKLVVRDQEEVLLTSANLNPTAFATNVEAGVHLRDAVFARQVATEVDGLVSQGVIVRVR